MGMQPDSMISPKPRCLLPVTLSALLVGAVGCSSGGESPGAAVVVCTPVVDGQLTGWPDCQEFEDAPYEGIFGDLYIAYRQGRLHALNDWHLKNDAPADPDFYNLFELDCEAADFEIRVFGDQTITVWKDGALYDGAQRGGAWYGPSAGYYFDHTQYEFEVAIPEGRCHMKEADPGMCQRVPCGESPDEILVPEPTEFDLTLTPTGITVVVIPPEPDPPPPPPPPPDPCIERPWLCIDVPPLHPCDEPQVGEFCYPCDQHSECFSELCLQTHRWGRVCSERCIEGCPDGMACKPISGRSVDPVFICVDLDVGLCDPCATTDDCSPGFDNGARCLTYADGASYCATPCDERDCPADYSCKALSAGDPPVCLPNSGSCEEGGR